MGAPGFVRGPPSFSLVRSAENRVRSLRWLPPGCKKMGFRKLFIVAFAMLAAVTLHGCGCDESELASCATSGVSAGCCEEWSEAGGDVISGLADCNNACD